MKPLLKKLQIRWLNKCKCGNKVATITTSKGDEGRLWDDDDAVCNACGRKGVIQCVEGHAAVLWETDAEFDESNQMHPAPAVNLADLVPDGWRLVPANPTWEMLAADGCNKHHEEQDCSHHENRKRIWRAMLEAAPKPEDKC